MSPRVFVGEDWDGSGLLVTLFADRVEVARRPITKSSWQPGVVLPEEGSPAPRWEQSALDVDTNERNRND
jgi:hypothetical protein